MSELPKFLSIRQVARTGILGEYRLRCLLAEGRLPGIWTGNKFLINLGALAEQLERESRAAAGMGNDI